jgi:hypothetical protein
MADSPANEAAFGRPGNSRRPRQVLLPPGADGLSDGTHLVLDAELTGCRTGEVTLVSRLPRSCDAGQLVLADREFLGVPLWRAFSVGDADLLWRVPANRVLPVERMLRDGSGFLASTLIPIPRTVIRSRCGWWPTSCTAPAGRPRTTGW